MTVRQATVIPYCPECRTSFAVHCNHAAERVVWVVDGAKLEEQE